MTRMKQKPNPRPQAPRRPPRKMFRTLHARAAATGEEMEDYEQSPEPNMKFSHALIVVLVLHVLAVGGIFAFNSLKSQRTTSERAKASAQTTSEKSEGSNGKSSSENSHEGGAIPGATPEKGQAKNLPPEAATYTVLAGDTLGKIAKSQKSSVESIEQANGLAEGTPIRIGQVLKIPQKPAPAAPKIPAKQETAAAKAPAPKSTPAPVKPEAKPQPAAKVAEAKPQAPEKLPDAKPTTASKPAEPKEPAAQKAAAATPTPAATKGDAKPAGGKTYTVAKGDNPYSIAKKLKVGYNELVKANNIQDPTKLQIGQILVVP